MNGQMESYEKKQRMVDEYLQRVDIYAPLKPMEFDLRGYADYLSEHNIDPKNVPEEVAKLFCKEGTENLQHIA